MSTIARAFTTRRVKMSTDIAASKDAAPQRSNTTRAAVGNPSIRNKISGPLQLIHTTNMLSYNAPDIRPRQESPSSVSSAASTKSVDEDSDSSSSSSPATAASSPPTSPDVSPSERLDTVGGRSLSPEPNHLSCYFMPPGQASSSPVAAADAPVIPQRAPSHTKKASYEAMARSRSNSALNSRMSHQSGRTVSTKSSFTFSSAGSRVTSTSTTASSISASSVSYSPKPPVPAVAPAYQNTLQRQLSKAQLQPEPKQESKPEPKEAAVPRESHPFGNELAQVTEIAEEYGVKDKFKVLDEEEKELVAKGLHKFTADDYLTEIHNLINSFFSDAPPARHARPVAAVWI